jgi:hypothetical protein
MPFTPLSSLLGIFAYQQTSMDITFNTSKLYIWAWVMLMILPFHALGLWSHGLFPFSAPTEAIIENGFWAVLIPSIAVLLVFALFYFGFGFGHLIPVPTNGDDTRSTALKAIVWIFWYYHVKRWSIGFGVGIAMLIRVIILVIQYVATRIHLNTLSEESRVSLYVKTPFLTQQDDKSVSAFARLNTIYLWYAIDLVLTWVPMFFQRWFTFYHGEVVCMIIGLVILGIVNVAWAVRIRYGSRDSYGQIAEYQ